MSNRTIYVNPNELSFVCREAQRIIEQERGSDDPFLDRDEQDRIENEARALVEAAFNRAEYLINLIRPLDAHGEHRSAHRIIEEVGEALLARRGALFSEGAR